jgi:hypothetical protein
MPMVSRPALGRALPTFLVLGLVLTACQRYEWVHPTRSLEQFGRDKFACEERASRIYPALPVTVMEQGGYIDDGFPHCHRHWGGFVQCVSRPPLYMPPIYTTRDVNRGPRDEAIEACLYSKGYQLLPAR